MAGGLPSVPGRLREPRSGAFRSLRTRNYRLYVGAQVLSTSGIWVQLVAEGWLVVRLTHSGVALGVTTALQFAPLLVLGAYGGLLVDRLDKRRLLMTTQTAAALLALATGLLVASGAIRIWMVWLAALLLGCVNSLDNPGRQAFASELVGPGDVGNAVALNNAVATAARAFGPALGGVLIATVGVASCFLVNAGSYLSVLAALAAMRIAELHKDTRAPRAARQVRAGFIHAWRTPALRLVLLMLALTSTLGFNFQVLLPLLASQTFARGGATYGLLMGAMGIGAVFGSLLVAGASDPGVGRVSAFSALFGASLAALAAAPTLDAAFAATAAMGACFSLFLASSAAALQQHAGAQMRGRVMALYTIVFLGSAPVGGPLVGAIAQLLNPRAGLLLGAAAATTAGLIGLLSRYHATVRRSTEAHREPRAAADGPERHG
jgi:MFS family permease